MFNITAKTVAIAIGATGVATGTGVFIYQTLNKEQTIKSLLESKGFRLLRKGNEEDKTLWKPKWEEFQKKHKKDPETIPEGAWKFKEWNKYKESADAPDEFQNLCEENSKKLIKDDKDKLFGEVKEFCATENKPAS